MTAAANVVIPTGSANLASVLAAFRRLGVRLTIVSSPDDVDQARRVVLPGVGTFGSAISRLEELGLVSTLRRRVRAGNPTLAICVGMQVLAGSSEESPATDGLGLADVEVTRFEDGLIVPQLAWAQVKPSPQSRLVEPGWAYFANSYRMTTTPPGWSAATASYGEPFIAAIERGHVLACQFHPELSGSWGNSLLARWIDATGEST